MTGAGGWHLVPHKLGFHSEVALLLEVVNSLILFETFASVEYIRIFRFGGRSWAIRTGEAVRGVRESTSNILEHSLEDLRARL